MRREIKFRVWNHNTKRFESKGYLTSSCESKRNYVLCGLMEFEQYEEEFNDDGMCVVFQQFTGFKDFDGKEIYEGDILEYVGTRSEGKRYKDLIEFDVECGAWYGKRTANTLSDIIFYQHNDDWKKSQNYSVNENQRVRIIGNCFENPELLKTNKEIFSAQSLNGNITKEREEQILDEVLSKLISSENEA